MRIDTKRRGSLLVMLALIAAVAATITWLLPADRSDPLPAITFQLLDGSKLALADLRGRPVLVNFWATTCGPCVAELPELARLYLELKPRGLELVAVAMPYDPSLYVREFQRRYALPFPIAHDVDGRVAHAFGGVDFIPTSFFIDRAGRIVFHQTGKLDVARVRRMIAAVSTGAEK